MEVKEKEEAVEGEAGGIVQHSIKRVKKKINDYILNNYNELFFHSKEDEETQKTATQEEILSNLKL